MRIFGREISLWKPKALAGGSLTSVASSRGGSGGWFSIVGDFVTGAWQRHISPDSNRQILTFSAVFAAVTMIASDVAKLRVDLTTEDADGIWGPAPKDSPYWKVLRKPNRYQNRIQFWLAWIVSKLLYGNAYVLKERDARGVPSALYVLDPTRVEVLVAADGGVYYRLKRDPISGLNEVAMDGNVEVVVPASSIIHDVMCPLWHPLVGVSPLYACALSAMMGNRIQSDSVKFFENMSMPSGGLSSPNKIDDETANRLKIQFEEKFGGDNVGRIFVAGDGLKYEAIKIPAAEAQLIEQLKWTVEDVARCFSMPLYKLGGAIPSGVAVAVLDQGYYSNCIQKLIESAELCLDEGLGVPVGYATEFDLDGLIRMDAGAQIDSLTKAVSGGIMTPNEARKKKNLKPVKGGDAIYLQHQNYSTEALAARDARPDPFATATPPAAPPAALPAPPGTEPEEDEEEVAAKQVREFLSLVKEGLECTPA